MHWTYQARFNKRKSDLEQGDIVVLSSKLRTVIQEQYPKFLCEGCFGFLVTTQSCDLARRKSKPCRATHIGIAPIRTLRSVLLKLLNDECKSVFHPRIFSQSEKEKADNYIRRIFNYTEYYSGVFYLHEEEKIGIGEESVALLREIISLDVKHYQMLTKSREGRLKTEFQHVLGWLVGYLYSRIGLKEDWSSKERRKDLSKRVKEILKETPSNSPIWMKRDIIEAAKEKSFNPDDEQHDTAQKVKTKLLTFKAETPNDLIIEAVENAFNKHNKLNETPENEVKAFIAGLKSDSKYKKAMRVLERCIEPNE